VGRSLLLQALAQQPLGLGLASFLVLTKANDSMFYQFQVRVPVLVVENVGEGGRGKAYMDASDYWIRTSPLIGESTDDSI
jgi:hypothetical protein